MIGMIAFIQFVPILIGFAIAGALGASLGGCAPTAKDPKSPNDEPSKGTGTGKGVNLTPPSYKPGAGSTVAVAGDELSADEYKLYEMMMEYRAQKKLPRIPLSKSLTIVANRHVRDLHENVGHLTHGWSDAPYDPEKPKTYPSMWTAPQRLKTGYPSKGYEIAHWHMTSDGEGATPQSALAGWKSSPPHNATIINEGIWKDVDWNAIGVGIYMNYAVAWFGEVKDPKGEPPGAGATVAKPKPAAKSPTAPSAASESAKGCSSVSDAEAKGACEAANDQCRMGRGKGGAVSCEDGISFCVGNESWPVTMTTNSGEFEAEDQVDCFQQMNTFFSIGFKLNKIEAK